MAEPCTAPPYGAVSHVIILANQETVWVRATDDCLITVQIGTKTETLPGNKSRFECSRPAGDFTVTVNTMRGHVARKVFEMDEKECCLICMESGNLLSIDQHPGTFIHRSCWNGWTREHKNCPFCRAPGDSPHELFNHKPMELSKSIPWDSFQVHPMVSMSEHEYITTRYNVEQCGSGILVRLIESTDLGLYLPVKITGGGYFEKAPAALYLNKMSRLIIPPYSYLFDTMTAWEAMEESGWAKDHQRTW